MLAHFHGSAGHEQELLTPLWDAAEEDGAQTFSSTYLLWDASFLQPVFKGCCQVGQAARGAAPSAFVSLEEDVAAESAPCVVQNRGKNLIFHC